MSPLTATESPKKSTGCPSEAVSLASSREQPGPSPGGLHEHIGGALSVVVADVVKQGPHDHRIAAHGHRYAKESIASPSEAMSLALSASAPAQPPAGLTNT